ncbi:hypothetical protein [Nocardiopsis lambiniae]|uniref:Uncharacterized protein n=1 Tax=Nocardiopsis lambiniae TaxID=3075539 RepID=A0ABU2M2F1_9ACTN|nr:hypothetical protein [Nocardiopsis sp. DSM 44743]MDT0326819.1 hypothetical protein [Nocardiopsis sp. DSM 44743]
MSDLIDPSNFPVPKTLTYALDAVAAKLKTDGTDLTDTAGDITGAWAGLDGIYSAPEDETLFNVLKPITGDAGDVSSALSSTSNALSDFAEKVRDIKARWATLRTDSNEFLRKIDNGDKEGWRDGGGFLWWKSESAEVGEHNELLNRAAGLLHEFQEAERTCANAITGLFGGTTFIAQNSEGSVKPGSKEFVYGFDKPLEGVPMEWGAPQTTDHAWYNDFGDAVGDFFVGIAEDAGGMVGAHGPNGWFSGNWGDNLWDYWGGTVEGLAGLAGVGKDENGDWGFSWSTMGNSWKEAAHAVVPWEEWGERPWYTIGTALLNVGAVVGGALLTATGVGAVVGVPLMAWRGAKIVNSVGGSRTPDVPDAADLPGGIDPALLARVPRFGDGSITPVDLSSVADLDIDGADLGRMNEALERLNASTNNNGNGQGSGTPEGTDGRRAPVTADAPDAPGDTSSQRVTTTRTESTPEGTERRRTDTADDRDADVDAQRTVNPTARQLDDGQEVVETTRGRTDAEQDDWVASQTAPDDISSVNDTPVQRYETEPSRFEAEEKVEVDSAGNEINARNDGTVTDSAGGTATLDTPRGGTAVIDVDSGSGRGGAGGTGGPGHGAHTPDGNGLPDGPERLDGPEGPDDLTPGRGETPDAPERREPEYVQRAGGMEGDNNPRANMEAGEGFYDADGRHIEVGYRDENGLYFDDEGNRYVDVPESARALERYNEIRANDGDVDRISENTGFDGNVLGEIKQHLFFREHPDVPAPPDGRLRSGRFAPMDHIADLWRKAEAGTLDASEANHFRRLVAHEYVEARLMREGVPYRSRDPQLWHDDYYIPTRDNNGAHDISPLEGRDNNFALWEKWGIPEPEPNFRLADDMSNLDRVAANALDWWRERNPEGGYPTGDRPSGSAPGMAIDIDTDPGGSRSGGSGGDIRPDLYDSHPSTRINPDLADDAPRRADAEGPDADTPTNGDSGSNGDKPKVTGYGKSIEQKLELARPHLEGLDTSSGKAFVKDFVERLNASPELVDIFYRASDGHRWSVDDKIGNFGLPEIKRADDGTWEPKSDLPTPPKPDYLLPEKREFFSRREGHADNAKLDLMAGVRRDEIDSHMRVKDDLERKTNDHNGDNKHPDVVALNEQRSQNQGRVTRASEFYGEETARSYLPEIFDGKTKYDVQSIDTDGNITKKNVTLPEIIGGDVLGKVETAPASGNYQFDLVHRTADEGFVITEAKGDVQTELGERKVGSGTNERRVSQGTEDYLRATFDDMIERGKNDPRKSDKPFGSGYVNERDLALKMLSAFNSGKLHYVEVKGASTPTGEHRGVSFGMFDISPSRPGN